MTTPTDTISHDHQKLLLNSAVDPKFASEAGTRSVTERDELPEELQWAFDQRGPGVLFWHTDHHGNSIPQFAPDSRPDGESKYLQAPNSGTVPSVHPSHVSRVGRAETVIIQEGTKQALCASQYAPLDTLVVGIQGCWGWSSDSMAQPWLDELTDGAKNVIVSFDGDVNEKRSVWDAGARLRDHLQAMGVQKVKFIRLPVGGSRGLDDFMATKAPEKRETIMENLIHKSRALKTNPPAKKRKSPTADDAEDGAQVFDVRWEEAEIRTPVQIFENDDGKIEKYGGKMVADFAARIARTHVMTDLLSPRPEPPAVSHDIEVKIDDDVYEVKNIADADLEDIRLWLSYVPHGLGTGVWYGTDLMPRRGIIEALRVYDADNRELVTVHPHTGWAKNLHSETVFAVPNGAMSTDGMTSDVYSDLAYGTYNRIGLQNPENLDTAVPEFLSVFDRLSDSSVVYTVLGGMALAAGGLNPRGCAAVVGRPGTGKSTVLKWMSSVWSPKFGPRGDVMASFNSTANSAGDAGAGLNRAAIFVDDLKRTPSIKKTEEQANALDRLSRRGYDGGSAGRGRQRVDRVTGRVKNDESDSSCPFVFVSAEVMPSATEAESLLERFLVLDFDGTELQEGTAAWMRDTAEKGVPNQVWSGYIRWLAQQIDDIGLAAWTAELEQIRVDYMAGYRDSGLSVRSAEIAVGFAVGCELFFQYIASTGHEEVAQKHIKAAQKSIVSGALRHTDSRMLEAQEPHDMIIDRLRSAVASGSALLIDDDSSAPGKASAVVLGGVYRNENFDSEPMVAVDPHAAATLTGARAADVVRDLKPIAIRRGSESRVQHSISLRRGMPTRVILIPQKLWFDGHETLVEAGHDAY